MCEAADVIVLDGACSARPELGEHVDLTVLVTAPLVRRKRLAAREESGHLERWLRIWGAAEDFYFEAIRPPESYDLVLNADDQHE